MKWRVFKKGNKYVKRPQLEVGEWVILIFIALALDLLYLVFIVKGV